MVASFFCRAALVLVALGVLQSASGADRAPGQATAPRHDKSAQLAALRQVMSRFFPSVESKRIYAVPEYQMDLSEIVMAIDLDDTDKDNPLFLHEPVLRALPKYSRVLLITPDSRAAKVKERLHALGIAHRVRLLVRKDNPSMAHGGLTRWVRDTMLVAQDSHGPVLLTALAHKDYEDLSHHDLDYLDRLVSRDRHVLRIPVFVNGGNTLVVARSGQRILLVGNTELKLNRQWMAQGLGLDARPQDATHILKAATRTDKVVVLPNSQHLYHLDMIIAPLADGVVGVLNPLDAEQVEQVDRDVLTQIREALLQLGFRVVDIPTSAQRIKDYRSPANAVPFIDRKIHRPRVLVPQFPEPPDQNPKESLNAKVLAAYRGAGLDPIPVEDRFHLRFGSIHCAMVPLR